MNINVFFSIVSLVLIAILVSFKPRDMEAQKYGDLPLFNISLFTMYEFDTDGLRSIMSGQEGTRYEDRYTIKLMNYTDNTKEYVANMKSNSGIYTDDNVYLDGDVVYYRDDGLTFETQNAVYNKTTTILSTDGKFALYRGDNKFIGKKLKYNNSLNTIQSSDVSVVYQLEKSNKWSK